MVCVSVPTTAAVAASTTAAATTAAATTAAATAAAAGTAAAATGTFASTLSTIGTIAALGGTAVSALGAYQQGRASSASAKYNASISLMNQNIAEQNSQRASQAGEEQVAEQQRKTRSEVGQLSANAAASGLEMSGSESDVINSASELGQLNALNIRASATQQAYGYKNQALTYGAQSGMDTATAANDSTAGAISTGSTLLSGTGNTALTYGKFLADNSPIIP